MNLCSYGCKQDAIFIFKNGKHCCSRSVRQCPQKREISRIKNTGLGNPNFGKKLKSRSIESRNKMKDIMKGKNKGKKLGTRPLEVKEKIRNKLKGRKIGKQSEELVYRRINSLKNTLLKKYGVDNISKVPEVAEKHRMRMLNGGASYVSSFNKNPSKPQVELYKRVKELYSTTILNYPVKELNVNLDVAIPELKIWFESDGSYWHKDKEKDLERKNRIEEVTEWKLAKRYSADFIEDVPSKEQIENDIKYIVEVE